MALRHQKKTRLHNPILESINELLSAALTVKTENELGNVCLDIARKLTQSKLGLISEINDMGFQDIAISVPSREVCRITEVPKHRAQGSNIENKGIYSRIISESKGFFTNDIGSHPDHIGFPDGHPPIKSFLGVPLILEGSVMGMIAVGNREDGYTLLEQKTLEALAPAFVQALMHKRSEEALKASESRFKSVLDNSLDCIYRVNLRSKRFEYISPSVRHIVGYSPEDLLSLDPEKSMEMIHPEDLSSFRKAQILAEKTGKAEVEYRQKTKNGNYRWISNYMSISRDSEGKPLYRDGNLRDITDRKKMENEIEESEKKYRDLIKYAPTGIYELDFRNKKFVTVNDAMCILTGFSREELLAMNPFDILDNEGKKAFQIRIDKWLRREKPEENVEYKVRAKDGHIIHAVLDVKFTVDANGKPVGATVVGHDITERKIAENKLREAQNKLRLAMLNGNIGIWEWDLDTNLVHLDEKVETMFGLKSGSFGNSFKELESLINEEDLSHIRKAIRDTLEKDFPFETVFRTKNLNGNTKYISCKGVVNKDKEGKPRSFTGVSVDVTELREGTEQLVLKLNEELLRSNKELESFAYVASHDLQEPLRMVSSFTQLLSRQYGDKLDDKAKEYIQFAVDGAKRMYDLLNGLLDYSRIGTKGKAFDYVKLSGVLDNAIKNLSLFIEEKGAMVNIDKMPSVIADESQMIQLFQNLISNSLKFSIDPPRIYISCKNESDHYVFSVKDQGIGIEPQYFDKIFQIFQRLMPKDQYEGTGIGLAICKRIVERHGGRIWVESEPGKGCTFFFTLSNRT